MNAPLHREMPEGTLDAAAALSHATSQWDNDIVRQLTDYIQIPAKSQIGRASCRERVSSPV